MRKTRTNREIITEALEGADTCCHAGSPRGISDVYCYIPVVDAVDVFMRILAAEVLR